MGRQKSLVYAIILGCLRGKTPYRTLFNQAFASEQPFAGLIVDIGGTAKAGYRERMPLTASTKVVTVNTATTVGADIIADAAHIPELTAASVDAVWCFNLLEHVPRPERVVQEIKRLLKPDGRIAVCVPFLVRVHPDPEDYHRFTAQGLERLFVSAGLSIEKIEPLGYGPFMAAFSQLQPALPRFIAALAVVFFYCADWWVLRFRPEFFGVWPLGYYVRASKTE